MTYQNVQSVTARRYILEKMVHYLADGAGMIHVMKSDIMKYKINYEPKPDYQFKVNENNWVSHSMSC